MTIDELKEKLIDELDLDPAFFVGGFGGAMLEKEEILTHMVDVVNTISAFEFERHHKIVVVENKCQVVFIC